MGEGTSEGPVSEKTVGNKTKYQWRDVEVVYISGHLSYSVKRGFKGHTYVTIRLGKDLQAAKVIDDKTLSIFQVDDEKVIHHHSINIVVPDDLVDGRLPFEVIYDQTTSQVHFVKPFTVIVEC